MKEICMNKQEHRPAFLTLSCSTFSIGPLDFNYSHTLKIILLLVKFCLVQHFDGTF